MTETTTTVTVTKTHNHKHHQVTETPSTDNNKNNILASVLHNLSFKIKQIPFFNHDLKKKQQQEEGEDSSSVVVVRGERGKILPMFVSFGNQPKISPPVELDCDSPAGNSVGSNQAFMWQVYAITGFMVARWVWSSWKKRKEMKDKKDSSDNDQTPNNNDDQTPNNNDDSQVQ